MSTPTPTPMPEEALSASEFVTSGIAAAADSTNRFMQSLPVIGTKLLLAGVAILVGWLALRIGRRVLEHLLRGKQGMTSRALHQRDTLRSLAGSVFSYIVYFVVATVVLSTFGVNVSSLIAVAGVGGVAIGFGAQTLVKDIISGVFLWAEGNMTVGDWVQVGTMQGRVEAISLRTTSFRDFNGNLYIVPNGDIRSVTNMSREHRRALVEVRLSYEEDLEFMLGILREEMDSLCEDGLQGLRERPQVTGVTSLAGDCITAQVAALCDASAVMGVESELRRRIKARFDKEKVLMPHAPVMPTPRTEDATPS